MNMREKITCKLQEYDDGHGDDVKEGDDEEHEHDEEDEIGDVEHALSPHERPPHSPSRGPPE